MKRFRGGALVLSFGILLSGCNTQPGESSSLAAESRVEEYEIDVEGILESEPVGQSTDPALMQNLWENYLFDGFLNLFNGMRGDFTSPDELDALEAARYLNFKMERNGDTSDIIRGVGQYGDDISIPLEKLREYSQRYFDGEIDFSGYEGREELTLDDESGLVTFYPSGGIDSYGLNPYDDITLWPHWRLDSVDLFDHDVYVANVSETSVAALEGDLFTRRYVMKKREDGSFYFLGSEGAFNETNRVSAEGVFTELAPVDEINLGELTMVANGLSGSDVIFSYGTNGATELVFADILTGEVKNRATIVDPIDFMGVRGGKIVVLSGGNLKVYSRELKLDGHPRPLPEKLLAGVSGEMYGLDFSDDLQKLAFCDYDGVKVYEFSSETLTLLPETAPYLSRENVMESESFKSARFAAHDEKLWLWRVGFEWTASYALYDLGADEMEIYPYGGGYEISTYETARGIFLIDHVKEGGDTPVTRFVDYATGEISEGTYPSEAFLRQEGPVQERYGGYLESVEQGEDTTTVRAVRTDRNQMAEEKLDFTVTAPPGCVRVLGATSEGKLLVTADYLGEHHAYLAG